ncbi:inositol monophosphatase family protein [Jatrophihabitans lederbergiae]|uniref:Inositol monophosphatase family protein n=1 Tax=Jatrophihabitans lederbergiae TaxID=3075547 RepID=A0ABU2JE63_9ACTN|nr:inositol monophosphatase family protein [Jatrophihabitans sp. DSM 44399]MDT0263265.1 inositol monophosphatase family protein [Jatrophihabitans sp. DSM 44399]
MTDESSGSADELIAFAERLADESNRMLRAAAARAATVNVKADNSFVTETDRAIETRLRERIGHAYPGHGILGEEYGGQRLDAELVWVLDPLDGTAHFITGIPVYGTLIGLSRAGRPWLGVLDYPATGDRWVGVHGSFARHNGVPVHARDCADPAAALATCSNPDFFGPADQPVLARLRAAVRYTMYGASSYGFAMLASGRTDLAVDCGLKPYDVFAPAAVLSGAGGVMTDRHGAELRLDSSGIFVAAGNAALHARVLELLR